jgi:hypothetical protein
MGRRLLTIEAPGVAGMSPDLEPHMLSAQQAQTVVNGYVGERGILHQRRGWAYFGSTGAGVDLYTIAAEDFLLAGTSRVLSTRFDSSASMGVYLDTTTGDDTEIFTGFIANGAEYLWRCSYNDQAIACCQDGLQPARFYSGSAVVDFSSTATSVTYAAGKATVTIGAATAASVDRGTYLGLNTLDAGSDDGPTVWVRILERVSSTVLTMEDVKASAAGAANNVDIAYGAGFAYPCVSVYDAGTGTIDAAADTFVGTGTKWFSGNWGNVTSGLAGDGLLRIVPATGGGAMYQVFDVNSDTSLDVVNGTSISDCKYHIARRMPAKDADNWNGMLCFAGVHQHKNRVYFWPPGANPALPPGFSPIAATTGVATPYDPATRLAYSNPEDFLCDYIEVPARDDDDPIVGIRATRDMLLVAKQHSLHAIVGSYPSFETYPVAHGVGCFDIRSFQTTPVGRVFCDYNGIWLERSGQIANLADEAGFGKAWRTLAHDFHLGLGDRCAVGYDSGHLIVSLDPRVASPVTYVIDVRNPGRPRLVSTWTNHQAIGFASIFLPSLGMNGLYWVGSDAGSGRIANSRPILDESGTARDADGHEPNLDYDSGIITAEQAGVGTDTRLRRVRVDANITNAATSNTPVTVRVLDSQRFDSASGASVSTDLGTLPSKTSDGVLSYPFQYGRKASQFQVSLDKAATASDESAYELHRIVLDFRTREKVL